VFEKIKNDHKTSSMIITSKPIESQEVSSSSHDYLIQESTQQPHLQNTENSETLIIEQYHQQQQDIQSILKQSLKINAYDNINNGTKSKYYIIHAAKTAGTSSKHFMFECSRLKEHFPDNILSHLNSETMLQYLISSQYGDHIPIIASHVSKEESAYHIFRSLSSSAVVYIPLRPWNDWFLSAIDHVLYEGCPLNKYDCDGIDRTKECIVAWADIYDKLQRHVHELTVSQENIMLGLSRAYKNHQLKANVYFIRSRNIQELYTVLTPLCNKNITHSIRENQKKQKPSIYLRRSDDRCSIVDDTFFKENIDLFSLVYQPTITQQLIDFLNEVESVGAINFNGQF